MTPSRTHLVLIPSYNTGDLVLDVVKQAHNQWRPIWVVIDGSKDDTPRQLKELECQLDDLRVIHLEENQGKGAAILHAIQIAGEEGFTHVQCFDSDGQHPTDFIQRFMFLAGDREDAMVLGRPMFGPDAPLARVLWRRMANFWTRILTLDAGVGDSLFGMRVYPIKPLQSVMLPHRWGRRFDFEPEVAIRLVWMGIEPINVHTPVRYLSDEEGGVSHFRYLRDNLLLSGMYLRLVFAFLWRLPCLLRMGYKTRPERPRALPPNET